MLTTNHANNKKILVVDDDNESRASLSVLLQDAGYDVSEAANGHLALLSLKTEERPAVILLDLFMPVMNGWQFSEAKKADPELAEIPVVVISSAAKSDPTSPQYIDAGPIVSKPFAIDDLLTVVKGFTVEADVKPPTLAVDQRRRAKRRRRKARAAVDRAARREQAARRP